MLESCRVISEADCNAIIDGLETISQEIADDRFVWSAALEDVHMNIEARLTEIAGEPGKKLHTARSRNDQVATDMRLFTRDAIDQLQADLTALQYALVDLSEAEADSVMPGPAASASGLRPSPAGLERHAGKRLAAFWRLPQTGRSVRWPLLLSGTGFPVDEHDCRCPGLWGVAAIPWMLCRTGISSSNSAERWR